MPHSRNWLLDRLPKHVLARIAAELHVVELHAAEVLAEPHQHLKRVYFPHSGIISCIVELKGGDAIETGMIGRDGVFGAAAALEDRVVLNRVVVQVPGTVSVMAADRLRVLTREIPAFLEMLANYEQFFSLQVQQTAACNAVHGVQPRICKWLARMHELAGPDLPVTQEFMAAMMGVQRTSVTAVAVELQRAGVISYSRGRLHIRDPEQLRRRACECEDDIRAYYRDIFDSDEGPRAVGM